MQFSYNWLRTLVPGLDLDPKALMRQITIKTAECEGVEEVGALLRAACTARVVSTEPIPETHNRTAVVETERYGVKTVVCGAPNCVPGVVTVYVPVGLKTIQGVQSDGMLASASELQINKDHTGIVELSPSTPFALEPDHIIEVDNKSLTHRPDLWGHLGMAREVAAITQKHLQDPVQLSLLPSGPSPIRVVVDDAVLCPRYSALVFENATVRPSPLWLQYRLQSIGLNPINNIVDVTNYVMAELAQPMHAFDGGRLHGDTIFVRPALAGETIVALNDQTYTLAPSNLVIADAGGPIAIAGVIGGLHSAIDHSTTRLVFESANFQAAGVRKTSSALKLRTDASMRFEKSQDPVNTLRGLARAIELLEEVSPGIRLVGGVVDQKAERKPPPPIELSIDWLTAKLGRPVAESEVRAILQALEFQVTADVPGMLSVTVPSWRATKDVSIKDDLLEEIGRMIGYGNITPTAPLVAAVPPPSNEERTFHRRVRTQVATLGFTEVYNYSFLSEEAALRFGLAPDQHLRVANPISSDQTLMRISLLPGIFRNLVENAKHFPAFRLFEIGREVRPREPEFPEEVPHLMAALFSREGDGAAGIFELKHLAECLMPGCEVLSAEARSYEHPTRTAALGWRGEVLGRLYELHPSLNIEGRAAILDMDLTKMQRLSGAPSKYQPLRRFPSSAFDLSVLAALREPVGEIERQLAAAAGPELIGIEYVRQYTGAPLPEDRKSVSYRLTVGAPGGTLSSDEVGAIRARIIEVMQAAGYGLRV